MNKFRIEDGTNSHHQPISANSTSRVREVEEKKFPRTKEKVIEIWYEMTIEEFQNRTKEIVFKHETLEKRWMELKNQISGCTVTEKVKIKEGVIGLYCMFL